MVPCSEDAIIQGNPMMFFIASTRTHGDEFHFLDQPTIVPKASLTRSHGLMDASWMKARSLAASLSQRVATRRHLVEASTMAGVDGTLGLAGPSSTCTATPSSSSTPNGRASVTLVVSPGGNGDFDSRDALTRSGIGPLLGHTADLGLLPDGGVAFDLLARRQIAQLLVVFRPRGGFASSSVS